MASEPESPGTPSPRLPPVIPSAPPPLPPPAQAPPPFPSESGMHVVQGRLHPLTLLFNLGQVVRHFLVPLILVMVLGRPREGGGLLFWLGILAGTSFTYSLARYLTFTYRVTAAELITTQGLLGRLERKIPLSRVQDVRIEQSLLQRLLGVVELQIETAGGQGAEANLAVLSLAEAEKLRALILARAGRTLAAAAPEPEREEILCRLRVRDLVRAGLTSNYIASALLVLLVVWQKLDDLLPETVYERLGNWLEQSVNQAAQGQGFSWKVTLAAAAGLLILGLLGSVLGSIVLFYGFTLARCGEDLRRAYGLWTRRSSSLPRRRIQLLRIDEPWLRRCWGLATLRADTAGSAPGDEEASKGGHDVLAPVIPRDQLAPLLPAVLPALAQEEESPWRRVSPRAIRRGAVKAGWMVLLLSGAACLVGQSWSGLWLLGLLPGVYWLNVQAYRHLGYRLGAFCFWSRQGWLGRRTWIVPLRNAQAIVIHQSPLDRWHGLASLRVDTAGQTHAGRSPQLHHLPAVEAVELGRDLARKAAALRYRW